MPETLLRNTFHVPAPPDAVRAHLSEPASYIGLSPLVVEVRDVRREAGLIHYVSVERFRFLGFLRYDNLLKVTLRPTEDAVEGEVDSPGGIRLAYRFGLTPRDGGTEVTDELRLRAAFGPLLGYAARQARGVQLARAGVLADRAPAL
ncbi:SRPBCC family protein [Nonomuraea wenchangensis]